MSLRALRDWDLLKARDSFDKDFSDAYRTKYPDKQEFSWWSYRAGARKNNKGWRIDYISVSEAIADKIIDAGHFSNAVHSDHCPVWLDIKL